MVEGRILARARPQGRARHATAHRRRLGTLCLAVLVCALAGCGSDESSGPSTGDEKVVVGFHNLDGGPVSLPETEAGAKAAAAHVNERLDGVSGRRLELVTCDTDGSPESSINCANKFIEAGAVAALQGIDIGSDAAIPVLRQAGIAETGRIAFGPVQTADVGHSFFFGAAQQAHAAAAFSAMKDRGVRRVTLLQGDVPAARSFARQLAPVGERMGLNVSFHYYPPGNTPWPSVIAAALRSKPDAIGSQGLAEPDCTAMIQALRAARYQGVIYASSCQEFIQSLGAKNADGVLLTSDVYLPAVKAELSGDPAQQVETYESAMKAAGEGNYVDKALAVYGFATMMILHGVLADIDGEVTAASTLKALSGAKGNAFLGRRFDCSKPPLPRNTACGLDMNVYVVRDGRLTLYEPERPIDVGQILGVAGG